MAITSFDEANGNEKAYGACGSLASVQIEVLDHKCTHGFYCDRIDEPHGGLRYGPCINAPSSPTSPRHIFLSLTMFAVLAIGSFALASLTAGSVVPAGVRPLNADSRLLKVSIGTCVLFQAHVPPLLSLVPQITKRSGFLPLLSLSCANRTRSI